MNRVKRRPSSLAPHGAPVATFELKRAAQQQRYVAHPPPLRASQEELLKDTYGQSAGPASPFKSIVSGSKDSTEGSQHRHHHTPRSPPQPRQSTPMRSDAIAFQYYTRQRQARRHLQQQLKPQSTFTEQSNTPVRQTQQEAVSGRGVSAPTTPGSRRQPTPTSYRNSRYDAQTSTLQQRSQQNIRSAGIAAPRSRSATPPPPAVIMLSKMPAATETSTSLMPLAPSRDAAEEGMKLATVSLPWSTQLTTAEQEQCSGRVQTLTQLPSTLVQVAMAGTRLQESRRLLHFYGGVYATLSSKECTPREEMAASLLPSSRNSDPVQCDSAGDGRTALLKALQRQIAFLDHMNLAAGATSNVGCRSQTRVKAEVSVSTAAATTAGVSNSTTCSSASLKGQSQGQREEAGRLESGAGKARPPRGTSSGSRAPRQLRGRVIASRVSTSSRSRNNASRVSSSVAAVTRCSPRPVQDFMKTIKPPHRHGLGGAPPPTSTPSSPRTPVAREAAHVPEVAKPGDGDNCFDHSPQVPEKQRSFSVDVSSHSVEIGQTSFLLETFSRKAICRVFPLSEVYEEAVGGGSPGAELSPGAAAARRVYWEQQHTLQQRSHSSEPHNSFHFDFLADGAATTAGPRYSESISTDNVLRHAPVQQLHDFESVSINDSVLRSDAHSFPSAPAASQDIPLLPPAVTPTPAGDGNMMDDAPPSPPSHGVVMSHTQRLMPPTPPSVAASSRPPSLSADAVATADSSALLAGATGKSAMVDVRAGVSEAGALRAVEAVEFSRSGSVEDTVGYTKLSFSDLAAKANELFSEVTGGIFGVTVDVTQQTMGMGEEATAVTKDTPRHRSCASSDVAGEDIVTASSYETA